MYTHIHTHIHVHTRTLKYLKQGANGVLEYYNGSHINALQQLYNDVVEGGLEKEDFPEYSGTFAHTHAHTCAHTHTPRVHTLTPSRTHTLACTYNLAHTFTQTHSNDTSKNRS